MATTPSLEAKAKEPFCGPVDKQTKYPGHSSATAPTPEGFKRLCYDSRRTDERTKQHCPYYREINHKCYCIYEPPQTPK